MNPSQPSSKFNRKSWFSSIPTLSDDPSHPAQVALRTYALSLSLSLGPSLIPFVTSLLASKPSSRTSLRSLRRVLRRELGFDGFAFAVTLSVGGGAAIRQLWRVLDKNTLDTTPRRVGAPAKLVHVVILEAWRKCRAWLSRMKLSPIQKTFLANVLSSSIGIVLLQAGRQRSYLFQRKQTIPVVSIPFTPSAPGPSVQPNRASPTLDLTLLLLVRAVDAVLQAALLKSTEPAHSDRNRRAFADPKLVTDKLLKEKAKQRSTRLLQTLTSRIDALVFWACSARIMWCFFYEPQRLPRSYVKWINTLANLDGRVVYALRLIREGRWSYISGSTLHANTLTAFSKELGYSSTLGDPSALPAYGGATANMVWDTLGVKNRPGVGGLPCELVHGGVGSSLGLEDSCTANASIRGMKAFLEAIAIYLPAHFLPILLTRPRNLLRPHRALSTLLGALRSAIFLSTFVSSYWYTVCITRSLVWARLFPSISHDFWDGPLGCVLAGCLVCGSSIWIENGRRRGEMALYVLPRAIRACLPDAWVRSGNRAARIAERVAFVLSFSTLIAAAIHRPDTLRGLSRWTLAFVTNGPNAGFWKRKRQNPSMPSTPSIPPTPLLDTAQSRLHTPKDIL